MEHCTVSGTDWPEIDTFEKNGHFYVYAKKDREKNYRKFFDEFSRRCH